MTLTPQTTQLTRALAGARNLLINCAGIQSADNVLIIYEDPALGWYDAETPFFVADVARELGASVRLKQTDGPDNRLIDAGALIDEDCDCCIFFCRKGDQLRFDPADVGCTRAMSYARTLDALASDYGCVDYRAMLALKKSVDSLLLKASDITITCPLGSKVSGSMAEVASPEEVTLLRFPMGIHMPIDASNFSGEVALARYLTPTGSKVYDPPWIAIEDCVMANLSQGRIDSYTGDDETIQRIDRHYETVAALFSLDPRIVHSWHCGIHPGCDFPGRAEDDPDRWSNTVFTNPRFLHFHTCASYPPGEICWMVLDPSISVDGVVLWEEGVLEPQRSLATHQCLLDWPELASLFAKGNGAVGLPG